MLMKLLYIISLKNRLTLICQYVLSYNAIYTLSQIAIQRLQHLGSTSESAVIEYFSRYEIENSTIQKINYRFTNLTPFAAARMATIFRFR